MIEHYSLLTIFYWLLMLPIAVFILVQVTNYFTGDCPSTFARAVMTIVCVGATVYFAYDFVGYCLVTLLQDPQVGYRLPPGFSYWTWLREPVALKWYVLGFVPFLRFLPILVALMVGGMAQVFLWKVPYRVGAVVFLAQVFLDLLAMVALSFAFTFGIFFYERAFPEQRERSNAGMEMQERRQPREYEGQLQELAHHVHHLRPEEGSWWLRLNADWESINRHFYPFYRSLRPVTRHLPLPAQDFLDSGGWLIALAGLAGLVIAWPRVHRKRKHYIARKQKPLHAREEAEEHLGFIGDALTALGPKQVLVKGQAARLRLLVLAPSIGSSGRIAPERVVELLDELLPGLSKVAKHDSPRVEAWNDGQTHEGFRRRLAKRMRAPEPEGQPSHWIVVSGEAATAKSPVFIGMAFFSKEATAMRTVEAAAGHWREVLAIRDVPEEERVAWR
jgi:hypothetical protein